MIKETFWSKLNKPFFAIAPMANVTDSAFRAMFAKYGKPDVTWTEFVSADGLCSPDGRKKLLVDLKFTSGEHPIVAQLFTGHADKMREAAKIIDKLGFDGLDINMGCPDRAVEKQGGGSAMIKNPKNALAVLQAAREGFTGPVSIKTRIGYNKLDMDWLRLLLEQNLPVLTVHLRTRKEMSDVPAHWELMPEIIKLRDEVQSSIPQNERTFIIGNGDVSSLADADEKINKYGCDGIMIGRGIFGKPWFFDRKMIERTPKEKLRIMLEHAKLYNKTFGKKESMNYKNFAVMKKHFKAYVSGWSSSTDIAGAKEIRSKLMEAETYDEVKIIVDKILKE